MRWIKERDLLVAQTLAFVQSVTGKEPQPEPSAPSDEIVRIAPPVPTEPMAFPNPVTQSEVRREIEGRVAAFRAHQQLFHRERDAYFTSVLAKARMAADSRPKPPGNRSP